MIVNSVFIGIEVQLSLQPGGIPPALYGPPANGRGPVQCLRIQYSFAAFFVLELIIRICADGWQFFVGDEWKWCPGASGPLLYSCRPRSWLDIFVVPLCLRGGIRVARA